MLNLQIREDVRESAKKNTSPDTGGRKGTTPLDILVIYSREKLKLFFPEGGATPKDVYFPSRRRGKYESEGVGTPQGEKSSISPRSL